MKKCIYLLGDNYNLKRYEYEQIKELKDKLEKNNIILGNGVRLGNNVELGNRVRLGNYVILGNNVELGNRVRLGNYVKLGNNVELGNRVELGNGVELGNYVILGNDVELGNNIELGDYVRLGNGVELNKNYTLKQLILGSLNIIPDKNGNYLLYKRVNKIVKGKYASIYDKSFIYENNKIAKAKKINENINNPCAESLHVSTPNYWNTGDTLIEVKVNIKDIITCRLGKLRVRKLKVLREVKI